MTTPSPAPDGSPDAPVDSPSGSALDSDSAIVPAGPQAGDDTGPDSSESAPSEASTGEASEADGGAEHTGANEAAQNDDEGSPFASAADLRTPGIRAADEHLAASEEALAEAKGIGSDLRGDTLPETRAIPAAPDAEPQEDLSGRTAGA